VDDAERAKAEPKSDEYDEGFKAGQDVARLYLKKGGRFGPPAASDIARGPADVGDWHDGFDAGWRDVLKPTD